ncbi:MAG: hypothetical protein GDA38_27565 [Hormoscilla sp. SP12CHS1]|nr:hypothetical protein [Hormoscilla sp. SP12CHS1]
MKEKIRLVLINMAVTAIMISSLIFLSSAVLFVSGQIRMLLVKVNNEEEMYKLSNYDNDRELMKVYVRELGQAKIKYEP